MTEPICTEENRCSVFPIRYPTIYKCLEIQRGCFWQTHEVDLSGDAAHWNALTSDEQYFIKMVLAFFASSDLIINENLSQRFILDVKCIEARLMYNYQRAMEDIHSEMYAKLIDAYISDANEKTMLLNAVQTIPIVAKKAAFAYEWMASERPYAERLIAFAAVEGVFFSGSFCAIYWIKQRGILPGLTKSNDFIARDEGQHVEGAVQLFRLIQNKPSESTAHAIIRAAVTLEEEFICEALPCRLLGMNAVEMSAHIRYVANRLLRQFNYSTIYTEEKTPFAFMDAISLDNKSNFFESRPSEYNKLAEVSNDEEDASYDF